MQVDGQAEELEGGEALEDGQKGWTLENDEDDDHEAEEGERGGPSGRRGGAGERFGLGRSGARHLADFHFGLALCSGETWDCDYHNRYRTRVYVWTDGALCENFC